MKAAAIGIHSIDDEGAEHYEEITIADTKEFGRWTQTITAIEILDTCLLDHGGTCVECVWNEITDQQVIEDHPDSLRDYCEKVKE